MARSAACSAAAFWDLSVTASRTGADADALPVSVAPWSDVARVAVAPQLVEATAADADGAAAAPSVTSTPSVLAAARPRRITREWDMGSPGLGCRGVGHCLMTWTDRRTGRLQRRCEAVTALVTARYPPLADWAPLGRRVPAWPQAGLAWPGSRW